MNVTIFFMCHLRHPGDAKKYIRIGGENSFKVCPSFQVCTHLGEAPESKSAVQLVLQVETVGYWANLFFFGGNSLGPGAGIILDSLIHLIFIIVIADYDYCGL